MIDEAAVQRELNIMQEQIQSAQLGRMKAENNLAKISEFAPIKEPNIIEYQLDVTPILDRIYHLLSGHQIKRLPNGAEVWAEPDDDRLKILTDYGVKQIMQLLSFYINPNTLLTNLDELQVSQETHDFGEELADLMFCKYEYFFYYPSPETLFNKYKPLVEQNKLNINDKELYEKCVDWSNQELQLKFRHFPMIWLALSDSVHKTLLRALKGEERNSLRKQMLIHQSMMAKDENVPEKKKGLFNWT